MAVIDPKTKKVVEYLYLSPSRTVRRRREWLWGPIVKSYWAVTDSFPMDKRTPLSLTSIPGRSYERSGALGVTTKSGSIPATATISSPRASYPLPANEQLGVVNSAGKKPDQIRANCN